MTMEHEPTPWKECEEVRWDTDTGAHCGYQVDILDEDQLGVSFDIVSSFDDVAYAVAINFSHEDFPTEEPARIDDIRLVIAQILIHLLSELTRPAVDAAPADFARSESAPH